MYVPALVVRESASTTGQLPGAAGAAFRRLEAASSYFLLRSIAMIPSARGRENNLFIFSFLACYTSELL